MADPFLGLPVNQPTTRRLTPVGCSTVTGPVLEAAGRAITAPSRAPLVPFSVVAALMLAVIYIVTLDTRMFGHIWSQWQIQYTYTNSVFMYNIVHNVPLAVFSGVMFWVTMKHPETLVW